MIKSLTKLGIEENPKFHKEHQQKFKDIIVLKDTFLLRSGTGKDVLYSHHSYSLY